MECDVVVIIRLSKGIWAEKLDIVRLPFSWFSGILYLSAVVYFLGVSSMARIGYAKSTKGRRRW